jgi:Asp-tRNA(Asn)/Glu-tRNA(Gln) amidotransferase A subunit family amidase
MNDTAATVVTASLPYLGAHELAWHFRARELSPVEVTQAVLRRIEGQRSRPVSPAIVGPLPENP